MRAGLAQPSKKGAGRGPGKVLTPAVKGLQERGLAALAEGDFPAAIRLLTDAFRQSPRPEVLYHLGRVASASGQALIAYDLFRRYLADPSREPDDAATELAEKALRSPPPISGSIAVQSDPGALVWVDERIVGTLPLPLPVLLSPGPHNVVLEFPNKKFEAPVQVQAARVTELRVSRASGAVLLSVLPAILLASQGPTLPADVSRRLADAVEQAARAEQHTTLSLDSLLPQPSERDSCLLAARCTIELAQKNKAEWVLQQRIVAGGDAQNPTWKVTLRVLHIDVREPAAETELTCSAAKAEVAAAALKESVGKMLGSALSRPRGTLVVEAEPAGAMLRLGQRDALSLPHRETLWAGSYPLLIVRRSYRPQQPTAVVREGQATELRVQLEPETASVVSPDSLSQSRRPAPRPKLRLALAGTMIGVGLGLAIVGGLGIAKHGGCVDEPELANGNCQTLYKTLGVGSFALGSGILLVGSGIVLGALPGSWTPVERK